MASNYIEKAYPVSPLRVIKRFKRPVGCKPSHTKLEVYFETPFDGEIDEAASIKRSKNRSREKVEDCIRSHRWQHFMTGTISSKAVADRWDYTECTGKVLKHLDNIKQSKCKGLVYVVIFEPHPSSGALHWHALFTDDEGLTFKEAYKHEKGGKLKLDAAGQKVRCRDKKGRPEFNWKDYRLGHTTMTEIDNPEAAERYIAKYITKSDKVPKGKRRFFTSHNCNRATIDRLLVAEEKGDERVEELMETHETVSAKTVSMQNGSYENVMTILILKSQRTESNLDSTTQT